MCGVAGVLDTVGRTTGEELRRRAAAMAATLDHRGPDRRATWAGPDGTVAFGHTRLAVVDLSEAGAQPMVSSCGRWTLAFNGELYNAGELRARLSGLGRAFRGHADTEVLVEALGQWGLESALAMVEGMYAFAAWDAGTRTLHLARDPLGEKPLYYTVVEGMVLFASELKALRAHPAFRGEIDQDGVAEVLRRSFIPAPGTIYRGVAKLPAGTHVSVGHQHGGRLPVPVAHYDYLEVARDGVRNRWDVGVEELTDQLDTLLRRSVAARRHADVPVGAFLSGGIDSSLVVALLQAQQAAPVRTFTVDVGRAADGEAAKAAAVAAHLGTEHTTIELTERDALEVVPRLPEIYDEPFADPSGIPTHLVARETRRHVTVAMSGDGGDELFAGYNRYTQGAALWPHLRRVPPGLRSLGSRALTSVAPGRWDAAAAAVQRVTGRAVPRPGDKLHRLAKVMPAADVDALYARAAWQWLDAARLAGSSARPVPPPVIEGMGPVERFMLHDGLTVLPDQMLTKVDRASMACSLEVRVPLLAPSVAALAWRLPPERKAAGGRGKLPLRAVLGRYLPSELIELPKQGFDPPLAAWLRGPLRGWAQDLLAPEALSSGGLLEPGPVRSALADHLDGARNHDYRLWAVLALQAWVQQ